MDELAGWESSNIEGKKMSIIKKYALDLITNISKIANFISNSYKRKTKIKIKNDYELENRIKLASEIFVENIEQIQKLSLAHNFKHFQFLQPHLYRKIDLTENEKSIIELYDLIRPVHGGVKFGDYVRKNDIYEDVMKQVSEHPSKYGFVHNLIDIFRNNDKENFFTLVHLNDSGYEIIAKNIYKLILLNQKID